MYHFHTKNIKSVHRNLYMSTRTDTISETETTKCGHLSFTWSCRQVWCMV